MKKALCFLMTVGMLLMFAGCGKSRIVHCDGCGKEIAIEASSNIEESWIVFCDKCDDGLDIQ